MMNFCTISTSDFYYKVYALCDSLREQNPNFVMHVLILDKDFPYCPFPQVKRYYLKDILTTPTASDIVKKYARYKDKLRWSLKPVFLKFLLNREDIDSAVYLDNDICFFSDYKFLFDYLENHSFLLTPHNYERVPTHNQNMLEANFRVGLYNAGFVGVNKNAVSTLQWWAECCLYRCEKNPFRGTFDDQKYLDLVPIMNEDAMIVRHQGCNVAEWNRYVCYRTEQNGEVLINGKYPVVFVHFNFTTLRCIIDKNDPGLEQYFERYLMLLTKYKRELRPAHLYMPPALTEVFKYTVWKRITAMGV